jgi:small subunit ribosomal protein S17
MADEERNEQVEDETPVEAEASAEAPPEPAPEAPPEEPGPPVPEPESPEPTPEPAPPGEPVAEGEEAPVAAEGEEAPAAEQPEPVALAKKKRKRVPRSERRQRPKPKREQAGERKPRRRRLGDANRGDAGSAGVAGGFLRQPKPEAERGRRQERRGVVVSAAMDKTIVVRVDVVKAHPRYKKVVRRSQRFHAHDEQNQAKAGDVVRIVETRPLSKTKNWRLAEVVEEAK